MAVHANRVRASVPSMPFALMRLSTACRISLPVRPTRISSIVMSCNAFALARACFKSCRGVGFAGLEDVGEVLRVRVQARHRDADVAVQHIARQDDRIGAEAALPCRCTSTLGWNHVPRP